MKTTTPLSKSQYGLYVECVAHAGEACYNLPYLYELDRSLDAEQLRLAIQEAVKAHPTLFTRIELNDQSEPVQTIDDTETFTLTIEEINDIEAEKQQMVVPFNIYGDRLFHIRLLRYPEHLYLFLDIHHIICDGTSLKVILTDINTAYSGQPLAPEAMTMQEVVKAEAELRQTPAFEEAKQWYAQNFDISDTFTQLMPDLEIEQHTEASIVRTLSISQAQVNQFCHSTGIFRSTLFTTAHSFLLAKYNNEQESLFTTVFNGRTDPRFLHSVGMTVQTLPVYAKFDADTPVLDYLRASQTQMSGCRKHTAYTFSDIMGDLRLQSNTMFAWHGTIFSTDQLGGKPMKTQRLGNSTLTASLYLKAYILNGDYHIKAEYNSNEYSQELIAQYLESYEATLHGLLSNAYLRDIDITTPSQVELLDQFNQTDTPYDDTQTIVTLFRRQAQATPDHLAVVYQDHRYTYTEVDALSDHIATLITQKGLITEDIVSVLIPRSEWMAIASLGVLKAGCAYQPLDPSYPKERLNFMMQDANAKLLIADEALLPLVDEYKGEKLLIGNLMENGKLKIENDAARSQSSIFNLQSSISPDSLLILLYTSGSTGVPKGCQLTHRNLVAFCHWYQRHYDLQPRHNVAAYASYGFDACMMDIYPALTTGATVHVIPEELRLDLMALNDYFEREHITHSFMTTQVGYQFAKMIDNHSLLHLSTGGEKLPSIAPPEGYHLHNGYGPTECTIFTTTYHVEKKMKEIPIGKPLDNMRLYIVDPHGHRLPIGAAGELWVSGPQVSRGYLNRPEKTAEVYIPNPFFESENGKLKIENDAACSQSSIFNIQSSFNRVYRTGDIVRYLPDGNIQFVGRRDGQVKIRGFRIELKEVEAIIREYPAIKDATVQAFDDENGGKYIAAYIVSDEQIDIEALNNFILTQKPPYMVPAATMQIAAIPLNQNQKVNKRALPKPVRTLAATQPPTTQAPLNVLEQELHEMVAEIVGNHDFGITTVLGYAGLTSITAIKLAVQVNKRFGVTLDTRTLVKNGTLQAIENEILKNILQGARSEWQEKTVNSQLSTLNSQKAPLTYAQTGVYFECLKNPTSTIYNIPYLLSYPEGTAAEPLADAVKQVVKCHPEMSVHFTTDGDQIMQTTDGSVSPEIPITQMTDNVLATYKNEFVQPFNLQRPPLYRFEVVQTESGIHLLMDVHHLIFDGSSADLFIRQVNAVLEGTPIQPEQYTYLDFANDQREGARGKEQEAREYFAEMLRTCEGASEIPADLPKTDRQGQVGEAVCPIDIEQITTQLTKNRPAHGLVTPAHLFLAATAYVVSRYTNNREVYLCTVSSGRSNLKTADTVGMFVNTLALGLHIDDVTVSQYLQHTSTTFDETLRHEDYPFARIAADHSFHPSIAYAYQVGVLSDYTVSGKAIRQELLELNVPKFKINIKIETRGVVVQYDDSLYSERLGHALAESIVATVHYMMVQPLEKVRHLSIVSPSQEVELSHLRQTATGDSPFKFFHHCISHYAQTQPDHEALVACDATFTYKEMEAATNLIATALWKRGVKESDRVALLLPRTSRLILSLFGVLKAGAAYIPCDPDYPADRIKLILEDSEARYIITTSDRLCTLPTEKAIDVEELIEGARSKEQGARGYSQISEQNTPPAPCPSPLNITSDALAYIIYTSGSTGRPKGVMLRHEGICNYLYGHPANVLAHAVLTDAERILSLTTISFDAALQDIGTAYFNGKTLILATEEQANNPLDLAHLINEQHIDMVSGTPSRWQTWLTSQDFCRAISNIKICRAGGEKFSHQLLTQMRTTTTARIFNCYGPTEITVASNNKELTLATLVTVGRPQLNVKEYIVDADGNELPVGVVGELYIGGRGVARGYNNLPEMNRERFIDYHGTRIYKSGDYAKWQPDGDVIILGRTDHQIKLRGLRIELGEIENVMLKVKGIKKVVILIRTLNGKEHLCAYYTADREIAPDALKSEISKSLTQYMVPTAYLQLPQMPLTPNGKTDLKALPEPQLAISTAYVAPANPTEQTLCDIFASILQTEQVGATDNFFELGGTSLVVTRVIIEADKANLHIAYGDVFANPTPRQLARLITGETLKEQGAPLPLGGGWKGTGRPARGLDVNYDYTAINNLLQHNTLENFLHGTRRQLGNVLLTGATGYLGIHILRQLIDTDAPQIYCLVRGKTQEKAENRLRTLLYYYFADAFKPLFGKRIHVILGDVTEDLTEIVNSKLSNSKSIDTLINCAAIVKHFSEGTEIEDVNIGGAQRCIEYSLDSGATLIHISTASTRGLWVEDEANVNCQPSTEGCPTFTEQSLYMGQYLGNKYIHSKFMAERLILEAVAIHGLQAKIMRVGNLAARSTDGEFQANFSTNSFMGRIKVYNMLGCCPHSMRNKRVEFSPINEVSQAILLLATTPKDCTVFHPYNIHGQFLGDVLMGLTTVTGGIRFVEQDEFAQALTQAKDDPQKARQLASLLAYQDMAHGKKTTDVARDNDYTTQVLYRLHFAFSPTSWDYVERMFRAISGFGYFEK